MRRVGENVVPAGYGESKDTDVDKMLNITSLEEAHLEDAATLVSHRYQRLRANQPLLPRQYAEVDTLLPLLRHILHASGTGVAAFCGDRLVGFLTGWQMPQFRGNRSTYSPEWANAADWEDSPRIYEQMYSQLADVWVADKYMAHYISLLPNDPDVLRAWHWMGFGMMAVDAIRGLHPIQGGEVNAHIRRAERHDLEPVMELHQALRQYMKAAPVFLLTERRDHGYYEEWLHNPDKVVWLAERDGEPVAFIRLGPADKDVCTIIQDEKTTSIYAAFTREKVRGQGVATALLERALQWARVAGYERCAVPFEPMNLLGAHFWLRHFQPVCYSLVRHIDHRLIQA